VKYTEDATQVTSTSTVPADDTIPQSGEGTAYSQLDTTITPTSAGNYLYIEATVRFFVSAAGAIVVSLYRDSEAGAIHTAGMRLETAGAFSFVTIKARVSAGSTSAQVFKLRFGRAGGSITVYLNDYTTPYFGGALKSSMTVTEVAA
jgi:hypothetical protein